MSTNKMALLKRKQKDVYKLRTSRYKVEETQNQSTFQVQFCGPSQTPYQIGKWKINLYLPEEYPYKSPSVGFLNRIYHPNIDFRCGSSGSVCLDVINQTWTPMYELLNIFQVAVRQYRYSCLNYQPSPLNQQAAHLYQTCPQKYNQKVIQFIHKYALNSQLIQTRKKSQQLLLLAAQELENKQQAKTQSKDKIEQNGGNMEVQDGHDSMEEEGSSISQRGSILEDEDLRNY